MKRKIIALLTVMLFLSGCGSGKGQPAQTAAEPPGSSASSQSEGDASEDQKQAENDIIPGSYTVPEGWVKAEEHSTDTHVFYVEEGHEDDAMPDNISINAGRNRYSLDEHEQFRTAINQQLLMQLDGTDAELNGSGTYTQQGDPLYIFTISEGGIVTTQYYIVRDHGFCLIHLTNFSGSENSENAARTMADSFVWNSES